jgi:2-hydroxycyclohexanecarboxyl-CoA dehydrogenase
MIMMNFTDKVILTTGAASGIGTATSKLFAQLGATVVMTDVNTEGGTTFRTLDITNRLHAEELAEELRETHQRLDVLVNIAGWDVIEPFMENSPEYWDKVVAINFMGPIQVTRAFLPLLIDGSDGGTSIINVASDAGRVGSSGETVYAGAKGGIIAFTKSLAREVVRKGVRVNCVCPGPTDTPLFNNQPEKIKAALLNAIPMKRLAQPGDIAGAIAFFASEYASFVTGQVLSVSGGLTMVD